MRNQTVSGRVNGTANVEAQEIIRVNAKGALSTGGTSVAAVTKSDSTSYDPPFRGLYVGTAGDVVIRTPNSSTSVTFKNMANGSYLDVEIEKVMAATTAQDIVGIY